jgi:ribosomal protein L11 methyltransferase
VTVPAEAAEVARARLLALFPDGFEEREAGESIELAAYTDGAGEERLRSVFANASAQEVADDWRERWRSFHRPARVGALWVGPPWRRPPAGPLAVVIDPGRAFGTGAHPTTRLCLELLQELPRGALLDVGCGSGVLAIAAAKLGYGPVTAVDDDPVAVEVTRANARANSVALSASVADARVHALPPADVAVANISLPSAEQIAPRLAAARLVVSGYLAHEQPVVPGLRPVGRRVLEGWAADVLERV